MSELTPRTPTTQVVSTFAQVDPHGMAVSVEQFLTQMAGPRHMCFGLEGLACGPGRLVSPDGSSGCQVGCREGTSEDGSSVLRPLHPGPQEEWLLSLSPRMRGWRPGGKRWLASAHSAGPGASVPAPKDRLAGLGPELQHGTVLSPQVRTTQPAWSQVPTRVPSGLSGSWLVRGSPSGVWGKGKSVLPSHQHHQTLDRQVFALCLVPCGCQGTMNPLLHGPQVLMKWTKGEDTKLCRVPSLALTYPKQPGGLSTGTT